LGSYHAKPRQLPPNTHMFKIGEFSKIAQVSGRLLRYYDEIGLLKPQHTDPWTGYRYYTAEQLPRLNRILALKELGLSLDQIQKLLDTDIGTDAIRKLYLERKAQLEQSLRDELVRLQQVQLRLSQLDHQALDWMPDVVIKRVPSQSVLAYRDAQMTVERLYQLFDRLNQEVSKDPADNSKYGALFTVLYSDIFTSEAAMDLEIGVVLNTERVSPLVLGDGVTLTVRELPAVEQMATIVHRGLEDHPITYNALGRWLQQHRYRIVGPGREVLLAEYSPAEPEDSFLEIAFPVERIAGAELDFLEALP
jgi:DNA-binding transcriptional MerR regulator